MNVDRQKIKNAVLLHTPIEITSYTLPRNMEVYIRNILSVFLEECHQEQLQEYLSFCLGELLTNAKKANTKRVYFKEKCLNIDDPVDYEKGMETFRIDTFSNIDYYLELQRKVGYYIKLDMQIRGDKIKIEIKNNAKLTVFEEKRIQEKIESVKKYSSVEEVMTNVLDQTEGAGLGIIIIILMLEKVGLAKENYQVECVNGETITRIILPCNGKLFSANEILSNEFLSCQNFVPVLSTAFTQLTELLNKTEIDRNSLYKFIRTDPTLCILLFGEFLKKDALCVDIRKALDLLTDQEIKDIYSTNNPKIKFVEETEQNKTLWNHSRNVAFFVYNIGMNTPAISEKYTPEELYLAGLLNNISVILLNNPSDEQKNNIAKSCSTFEESKKISDVFWNAAAKDYMNLVYTKRLGFKEEFTSKVYYWNYWELMPEKLIESAYAMYLAEMIQNTLEGRVEYYQIDGKVLDYFKIYSQSQFNSLAEALYQATQI